MLERVINFPAQVAAASAIAKDLDIPSNYDNISNIVVLGMGGSGIVGDFLHVMLRNSSIPLCVNKDLLSPRFVGENTLVLAVTYSGKTSETLEALWTCIKTRAKVMVVTSSIDLKSTCYEKKIPCVKIPENGHSRASLGYLLVPLLYMLQKFGHLKGMDNDLIETISVLKNIRDACSPELPLDKNPARFLASELVGRLPIVYGESNFTDVVALRWKQQFNENSKIHCYYDQFPELLHNEIEAWDGDGFGYDNYSVILLRDSIHEYEVGLQNKLRATKTLIQERGSKVFEIWSRGRSELARLLSLSYLGDLTSAYLAISKDVDASTVRNIEVMKKVDFGG